MRLTARQAQILACIKRFFSERGFAPTIREIGDIVGLSSSSTTHSHLRALEKHGALRLNPNKPRAIELVDAEVVDALGVARRAWLETHGRLLALCIPDHILEPMVSIFGRSG